MLVSELITLIRHSTLIEKPKEDELTSTPALLYTDEEIYNLIKVTSLNIPLRNMKWSLEAEIDESVCYLILLLVKKEIYMRLATGEARNYPLTAEGASLRKDYIFRHYMQLTDTLTTDYVTAKSNYDMGKPIQVGTLVTVRRHLNRKLYMDAQPFVSNLKVAPIDRGVELYWDNFKSKDGFFWRYDIIFREDDGVPIYDKVNDSVQGRVNYSIYDPRVSSKRIELPKGTYRVALLTYKTNSVRGVHESIVEVGGV